MSATRPTNAASLPGTGSASKGMHELFARDEHVRALRYHDVARTWRAVGHANTNVLFVDDDRKRAIAVREVEGQPADLLGELRIQPQRVGAGLEARIAPSGDIDSSRHCAEVDPLAGCSTLRVRYVSRQRFAEILPRGGSIEAGKHPCMDHSRER